MCKCTTRLPILFLPESASSGGDSGRLVFRRNKKINVMNTLLRWNPINELSDVQNRLSTLFGRSPARGDGNGGFGLADWAPPVDITEDDKGFLIQAELPDVKKEDIKVSIENGVLHIRGERQSEKEESNKTYHRIERSYGSFERTFNLPETTKPESMTAEYKDGLLTLRIPKSEETVSKAIEVKIK